jgi:hypothetical protein
MLYRTGLLIFACFLFLCTVPLAYGILSVHNYESIPLFYFLGGIAYLPIASTILYIFRPRAQPSGSAFCTTAMQFGAGTWPPPDSAVDSFLSPDDMRFSDISKPGSYSPPLFSQNENGRSLAQTRPVLENENLTPTCFNSLDKQLAESPA